MGATRRPLEDERDVLARRVHELEEEVRQVRAELRESRDAALTLLDNKAQAVRMHAQAEIDNGVLRRRLKIAHARIEELGWMPMPTRPATEGI